jgi:hypothetical protein
VKLKQVFLALALAAVVTVPASAANNDFALYGSYTKPQDADNSWGGGAKLRFGFFEIRSTYFNGIDERRSDFPCPPLCSNSKPRIQFVPLEAGLVYKFRQDPTIQPYLGAGGGYYFLRQTNSAFGKLNDEAGFYGVIGTDINFGRNVGLMIEGNYRRVRATVKDNSSDIPTLREGVRLQLGGPGVNAGIVWHF